MVEKLHVKQENHPAVQTLVVQKRHEIIVNIIVWFHFNWQQMFDNLWCDMVTMDAFHILLERPRQYDHAIKMERRVLKTFWKEMLR